MAFENISKGEFYVEDVQVSGLITNGHEMVCAAYQKSNAEFIAFCFNLQQRYDISKLEEAVKLLEKMSDNMIIDLAGIKQLLKQIKK